MILDSNVEAILDRMVSKSERLGKVFVVMKEMDEDPGSHCTAEKRSLHGKKVEARPADKLRRLKQNKKYQRRCGYYYGY
jgi:hypothetical protein